MPRLLAVSDLHVTGADDPIYRSLLSLIRDRAEAGDTLVLAGDLFDLFVGNKAIFVSRYSEFLRELAQAGRRGVRIHYIEGNHDFHVSRAFGGIPGLTVHAHDVAVEVGGKRFFFAHGDTVDPSDVRYRLLRGFFRSPLMRAFVVVAPGEWIDWIGQTSSRRSRASRPDLPQELPLGSMERLRRLYRNYAAEQLSRGYDFVVMGHCHDLDEMSFNIGGRTGQYVNVGYPRVHGSFLSWAPGEERIQREKLPV